MDAGSRVVRGVEATQHRWNEIADVRDRPHLLDPGPGDQDVAWSAFLQQQLSGLHARLGVKARAHHAVVEDVCERHERHPLVMRHIGAHDGHRLVLGDARGRVIERLVKAIAAARAGLGKTYEILLPPLSGQSSPPAPSRKARRPHLHSGRV